MAFKKGQSGNPKGRPKGSMSIAKIEIKKNLSDWATKGLGKFITEMNSLKGEKYVRYYLQALEYSIPKLNRSEDQLLIEHLNDDDAVKIIQLLIKQTHEKKNAS